MSNLSYPCSFQYEYGLYSTYASNSPERKEQILPVWEQITLQDHRNRHVTYLLDEGLLNMRRRAPMLGTWDDHETTNNAYGMGAEENVSRSTVWDKWNRYQVNGRNHFSNTQLVWIPLQTGAENHQPVCSANSTSPDAEKASASCDRDEGTATDRFTAAAQAYLEYLPLRTAPGSMGVVTIGTITQVIEWGKLATFVLFDTRITARSKEPTLKSASECCIFVRIARAWSLLFPDSVSLTLCSRPLKTLAPLVILRKPIPTPPSG
jgi:alkaline phosphatase D